MLKQFMNSKKSVPETRPVARQQPVYYEVFRDHWKQALNIFNKSLINDDDIQIVKSNLNQMINLLLDELNNLNSYLSLKPTNLDDINETTNYGPIWDFVFKTNIFETIFLWSLSYPEYLFDLKFEQLKYYESLIYQMQANEQTNLLLQTQINKPLFSLLNHCSSHNSELIEKLMISVLNQLCVCICKNANLLEIFFQQAKLMSTQQSLNQQRNEQMFNLSKSAMISTNSSTSKFFIFSLLIPYIHKEGCLGQQARDALLMIMQLSARNSNLAKYIVENTDFCPILATGLSGLYSDLPQKLTTTECFDEIRYLNRDDIISTPALSKFVNSLEFCNNVIQVSHSLIANQLLQYVYYGFLVPVIAPALTQNCDDEIIASTAYLDLFLRTINEPNLLKIFLKFILHAKFDDKQTLLDTLIGRINSNTRLCLITLMLFSTMIDFNSEEVMYKLILVYLLPCKHLMKSQILTLKQTSYEINGLNAQSFLSLASDFDNLETKSGKQNNASYHHLLCSPIEPTPLSKWFQSLFELNEMNNIVGHLDGMRFNFVDYLKDAKLGIVNSSNTTSRWSFNYDISNATNSLIDHSKAKIKTEIKQPSHELDYDAEEYLLNLNIFTTSLTDPVKSTRSTINLFTNNDHRDDFVDFDSNSIAETQSIQKTKRKLTKKNKTNRRQTTSSSIVPVLFDDSISIDGNILSTDLAEPINTKQKRQRMKRRERASDFYFLTFDNEMSDSDDTSSISTSSGEKNQNCTKKKDDEEDEEDESLTATSVSSTTTLNIESNEINIEVVKQNQDYRLKLIDYLFSNEENNKLFLNGNLNNFLFALDGFFTSESKATKFNENKNDLNLLCDQILNIYNEIFKIQASKPVNINSDTIMPCNESPNKCTDGKDLHVASSTLNLTTFPAFTSDRTSSHHSSAQSLIDNLATDSGIIELTNSMTSAYSTNSNENDIGPFLCALFNRLDHMLSNSLQINFLLTGLFAKLAYFPQLLLRSFLLNHNLVVQSNIKTLIQVLNNIKLKIDSCAQTYNNFSLLYFKAKLFLIKRIIDSKSLINRTSQKPQDRVRTNSVETQSSAQTVPVKKKFTIDRFLNFFLKPSDSDIKIVEFSDKKVTGIEVSSSQAELDLSNFSFNKKEANYHKQLDNELDDFYLIVNEWEDLQTRNIAISAVIYDEFIKELAAICQEHSILTND